jgi:hypothetical protein
MIMLLMERIMLVVRTKKSSVALVSSVAQDELMTKNPNTLFEIIQSDDWRSAVPNLFLRSSMFGVWDRVVVKDKEKCIIEAFDNKKIFSLSNYEILYSGQQLNQYDLSVWIAMMSMAQKKGFKFEDTLCFSLRSLAYEMDVQVGGTVGSAIKTSLSALKSANITVKQKTKGRTRSYSAGIITSIANEEAESTHTYEVKINKTIVDMFQCNDFTFLNTKIRRELKSKLAKWIHGYYSTHAKPIPMSIELIRKLSGSQISDLNDFKKELKKVTKQIQDVSSKYGDHFKGDIVSDMFFVEHSGSLSQMRHNIKRGQLSNTTDEIEAYKAKLEIESTPLSEDQLLKKQQKLASLKNIRVLNSRKKKTEKAIELERKKVAKLS